MKRRMRRAWDLFPHNPHTHVGGKSMHGGHVFHKGSESKFLLWKLYTPYLPVFRVRLFVIRGLSTLRRRKGCAAKRGIGSDNGEIRSSTLGRFGRGRMFEALMAVAIPHSVCTLKSCGEQFGQ